ncbi:hypothetical protein [Dyella sp.]|jgi:hypothetical protein|uniref:hypothetical protein n=1 Tax=Dyella sp. TaxID=1869338 RepID=UPI002D76E97D|nr:hypothetical protein [Dyella sp.]HET6432624.1 hypothetical protein [Dyella sp.]
MDELIAKAMQGVDPEAPGAFWQAFGNLMALVPWTQLALWSVFFVVVGAALGRWRGQTRAGVVWALLLGPIGWLVVLWLPRRTGPLPPPLPRRRR